MKGNPCLSRILLLRLFFRGRILRLGVRVVMVVLLMVFLGLMVVFLAMMLVPCTRFMVIVGALFVVFYDRRFLRGGRVGDLLYIAPAVHLALRGRLCQRRRRKSGEEQ